MSLGIVAAFQVRAVQTVSIDHFHNHAQLLRLNKFWRATGQSNLSDRMEADCSVGQIAVV